MAVESIHHDRSNKSFALTLAGKTAIAEYELEGDLMIFTHTFVPNELRGQGVAAKLVKEALAFARTEKKKVIPQCSYVEVYLKRHPEFADLLHF